MKVNSFPKQEKGVLADFFESPEYKSLKVIMDSLIAEWKEAAIDAPSIENLREIRGKIIGVTKLDELLRQNHRKNLPNLMQLSPQ